jgi:hypothetical protein
MGFHALDPLQHFQQANTVNDATPTGKADDFQGDFYLFGPNSASINGHKKPTTPKPKKIPVTNRSKELSEPKASPA